MRLVWNVRKPFQGISLYGTQDQQEKIQEACHTGQETTQLWVGQQTQRNKFGVFEMLSRLHWMQ
jgi:hypothetical protein